jgi:hypothetical protein
MKIINRLGGNLMSEEKMPHPGHSKHLCYLQSEGYHESNREDYKKLVVNAQYICQGCGRTAENAENLCAPEKL